MSVLVKGMRMPETCIQCPMQFGGWCYVSPPEIDERVAPTVDIAWKQKKPKWCPLEEQTSGSDLISRQAAIDILYDFAGCIVDTPNGDYQKAYKAYRHRLETLPSAQTQFHNAIIIPENATNGDMIKAMFPYIKIHEHEKTDICDAYIQIDIWDFSIYVSKEWWNAPYKVESEDKDGKSH